MNCPNNQTYFNSHNNLYHKHNEKQFKNYSWLNETCYKYGTQEFFCFVEYKLLIQTLGHMYEPKSEYLQRQCLNFISEFNFSWHKK